ncbi:MULTISPECIES: branched-chain amino acid ABC transporter permease [Rhizobium]|uniref:branched-chain amino acid ABC transporter permease n=1 Tax=Rhizobium TaxID=379 RepID=UPI0013B9BC72|nr:MULTISPECIES: branched-chain amino acid ABC transporter permease [Rhizobium]MBY3321347.1 branched-chain amino acid ABC transporter permease [Rhizobium laguerreae]MBY3362941.1 branched-chain amino acid ABC transporter permease [Rhizobium laguerreae]MCA2435839.1 branched-chain amino acid ABC transporter permease [Rhizobium leguminosarum]NEH73410.1 branched-chain amino acid ABC transporter permease [Rhizobium leguminosarum]NKM66516.1 branched-chain amino acid ABC transporter permease [Rhizobiu
MNSNIITNVGAAVLAVAVFAALPFLFPGAAMVDFIVYVAAYGLLAMSLNLLVGLTGLVAFGHAIFFASGSYTFGLLMQSGAVSIPVAVALTVIGTAALALVTGAICVRLKDVYFSFITLAFQMVFYSVVLTWVSLTGGDQGLLGGIPKPVFAGIDLNNGYSLYLFCIILFAICAIIMRQVWQSPFGYTLRLIRDNATRADFLGVNVFRMKLAVFVLSASIASVGGIILALFVSGAYPEFAFWTTSGDAIFALMLGGTKLFLGPLFGAFLLELLEHYVRAHTEYQNFVLGVVILLIVLGLKRGILDYVHDYWVRRRKADSKPAATVKLARSPDA